MLSIVDLQRILNTLDFNNYLFLKIGGFLLLFVYICRYIEICLYIYFFLYGDKVSLCTAGWPGTNYVDQAGIELKRLLCGSFCLWNAEIEGV